MKKILQELKFAIKNIDVKYFERNERDFAYELYHQMKLAIKLPPKVEITSESTKRRFNIGEDILKLKTIKKYFFNSNNNSSNIILRFPDLLIHEFDTRDNQLLAVEVKKSSNSNLILRDLAKLVVYCKGQLVFKKGILILVNPSNRNFIEVPSIKEMLKNFPEVEIWIAKPNEPIEVICG